MLYPEEMGYEFLLKRIQSMERILLDSMTNVYNLLYNFWRLFSIVLTILNSQIFVLFFTKKSKSKKKVLFHGKRKCLQPLEFLSSFSAGLTGRRVHCLYETRRSIVPVQCSWFLRSRMCPRAYFVRLHARIVWLTDTHVSANTVSRHDTYTRLLAWMDELGLVGKRGSY